MSVILLPRLGQIAVDQVLDEYGDDMNLSASLDMLRQTPGAMSYAASGGSPLKKENLTEIRNMLVGAAKANGFPERGSTKDRAQFDTDVAQLLGENPLFIPPESLRDDVWAFVTAVLAPDVVNWRFGKSARERYHGGVRNAFQRLWMRAWSLDRGPGVEDRWGLIRDLTEDAFVQIVERPSIGGDRRLALALAEGWVRMSEVAGRGAMEAIMRRAVIAFRLRNQIQVLAALDDAGLRAAVDHAFELARQSLSDVASEKQVGETEQKTDQFSGGPDTSPREDVFPPTGIGGGQPFSRIRSLFGRGRKASSETAGMATGAASQIEHASGARDFADDAVKSNVAHEKGLQAENEMPGQSQPHGSATAEFNEEEISEQLKEFFDEVSSDDAEEPETSTGQQAATRSDRPVASEDTINADDMVHIMIGDTEADHDGMFTYLNLIEQVAEERNLLSPKSREAIRKLKSGDFRLTATDQNSLHNLQINLSKISVEFDIPRKADISKEAQIDADKGKLDLGWYGPGQAAARDEDPAKTGGALIWKEIILPEGTDVRMPYGGETFFAKVSNGKISDRDGEFTPGRWANKVANNTSRNAWRDIWFKKPGEQNWVLADELRLMVRKQNT